MSPHWTRREFVGALSTGLVGAFVSSAAMAAQVKWVPGTSVPTLKAPTNATDCHHHIYDARFPADPRAVLHPPDALPEDYALFRRRLGTTRSVLVHPSTYGTDNRCTLAALAALGTTSRAICVVTPEVADAELKRMNDLGVKGIRFNLAQAVATTPEMITPLARRIAPLGWHVQINAPADRLIDLLPTLDALPCPVVFDHLAHIPQPDGVAHPLFGRMLRQLDKGRTWVKLSGAYVDSKVGAPTYADATVVARAYVRAAPERLVWGSDWPYPTEQVTKPDDARLFDLLLDWAPDERVRTRILVENPERLYGFPRS